MVPRRLASAALLASLLTALSACSTAPRRPPPPPPPRPEAYAPAADANLRQIESAVRRFAADRAGRLPTVLAELTTERTPEGEPYLPALPTDPWGQPYAYAVLSARYGVYDLRSYGADRLPGTTDDLVRGREPVPVR